MEYLLIMLVVIGVVAYVSNRRAESRRKEIEASDLEKVKAFAEEDVTKFGEELQTLDSDVIGRELDEPTRQDYQRALDEYESAKTALDAVQRPEDIKNVTEILEDGKYAIMCVRARLNGDPLPQRRPPCFFNPQHGPSTEDVDWMPPGGAERRVPVCAADAERVNAGAEPDIRKVMQGSRRVPYWQGGPAYAPFMQGYFAGYATMLPAFFMGAMMGGMWGGYGDGGYGDGGGGGEGGDGGGGDGGDGGGDFGGGDGGGDFGGGDFGGDFGF